jgi:hypothetical protein
VAFRRRAGAAAAALRVFAERELDARHRALEDEVLGARLAPAQLDDLVLAADRVGAAVEHVGDRQSAGEIAVDVDVGRERTRPRFPVIELTVVPPSLIESAAMCEWQSMMPGEMNLPAASTTSAPAGIGDVRADGRHLAVAQDDRSVWIDPL